MENKNLTITTNEGKEIPVIDSREVAEMLESKHYKILEKLEGTKDGKFRFEKESDKSVVEIDPENLELCQDK